MLRCILQRAENGSLQIAVSRKWFAANCREQKMVRCKLQRAEMVRCKLQRAENGSLQVAESRNGSLQISAHHFPICKNVCISLSIVLIRKVNKFHKTSPKVIIC